MPNGRPGNGGRGIGSSPTRMLTADGRIISVAESIRGRLVPIPLIPDVVKNVFEPSRPGTPVVRPDDLLAIRVELKNMHVAEGSPPKLTAQGNSARLILHFPPLAITEETFFEIRPPDYDDEHHWR